VATSDADYCAEYATTCGKLRELHSAKRRIAEMEKELSLLRPIGESIDRISKSLEDGTNASEPLVDFCSGCERVAELEAERDALQARRHWRRSRSAWNWTPVAGRAVCRWPSARRRCTSASAGMRASYELVGHGRDTRRSTSVYALAGKHTAIVSLPGSAWRFRTSRGKERNK
jgi:hypothetical protein